jgi:hypothetical protein
MQDWPAHHHWFAEQLSPFSNQDEMGALLQITSLRPHAFTEALNPIF